MSGLMNDIRVTWRRLLRTPGFTMGAVITLALGIGASTAVFAVVSGVLLRPLPVPDPERLVFITREGDVSIADGIDWRKDSRTLEEIALFLRTWDLDLVDGGEPTRLNASVAEPQLFRVLQLPAMAGRLYDIADNKPGAPAVAVISEGLWKRRFGADPQVIGKQVLLSDIKTTIVGVAPADMDVLHDQVDIWVPPAVATPWALAERGTNNFDAMGRLRAGSTVEESVAEMVAISKRLEAAYPNTNTRKIVAPLPLLEFMVGSARRALLVLLFGVAIVVFASSANLATSLLARSASRREEYAVRLSLGGGQGAIARNAVLEGILLSVAAGFLGVFVAATTRSVLISLIGDAVPRAWSIAIDGRVLGFSLVVSLFAAVVMAALPAWQVNRGNLAVFLRAGGRSGSSSSPRRLMDAVVGTEVALAVLLLVGSGLLLQTFMRLQTVPLGFDPEQLMLAAVTLPEFRYMNKIPEQISVFRQVVDRVSASTGIENAAYVITPPLEPRGGVGGAIVFRTPPPAMPVEKPGARARLVMGDYFKTIGTPLIAGRAFGAEDREGSVPVAIINERFAREFWAERNPLGEQIAFGGWTKAPVFMTVVGIVSDIKSGTLQGPDVRTIYAPYAQHIAGWQRWGSIVARTRMSVGAYAAVVQEALRAADPSIPVGRVEALSSRKDLMLGPQRLNAVAIGFFALIAFIVAFQGIYAILSRGVAERRRELGIRLAVGAAPRQLLSLVVARGLKLTLAGLCGGVLASMLLGRAMTGLLFEVRPADPLTFAAVTLLVGVAALLSSYLPGRAAARTEPSVALRQD